MRTIALFLLLGLVGLSAGKSRGRECVKKWNCHDGTVNAYGEGIVNLHAGGKRCSHFLEVNCKKKFIKTPQVLHSPKAVCGQRNPRGKIIEVVNGNRTVANFAEFPWIVAIFCRNSSNNATTMIGTGSILTPKIVLTAAHILHSRLSENLVVRAGEWDLHSEMEPYLARNVGVTELIIHEQFDNRNGRYDLALLQLKNPLVFTVHIMPLCLPQPDTEPEKVQRCFVAGWGPIRVSARNTTMLLVKAEVPLVENDECQNRLRLGGYGPQYQLHESLMCAGGKKHINACAGDWGGPLFCSLKEQPDRYQQVGVVAFGQQCQNRTMPVVFTNVVLLRDWILRKLAERKIDPNNYTSIDNNWQ